MAVQIPIQTLNEHLISFLKEALTINQNAEVAEKLQKCLSRIEGLEDYLENMCPPETPMQKMLFEATMSEPWEEHYKNGLIMFPYSRNMISTRHSTQFLKTVAEMVKAERILEIGMFTGYTAALFCETKYAKEVTTLDIDPFIVNFVKSRISGTDIEQKLQIVQGPALESLKTFQKDGRQFDLIFIDADKPNYLNYYKFILDNDLIETNGIILLDNTLWRGELFPEPSSDRAKTLSEVNKFIHDDPRVSQVILQICDGISMVKKV